MSNEELDRRYFMVCDWVSIDIDKEIKEIESSLASKDDLSGKAVKDLESRRDALIRKNERLTQNVDCMRLSILWDSKGE